MTDQKARKAKLYFDVISAINLIEEFIGPINLFDEYSVDPKTQSAIERQLSIVGEAIKKIKDIDPDEYITHRDQIIGLRNRLIHGYETIDESIIWSTIKDDLLPLREEMQIKLSPDF